jgi:hypothetical protein
MGIHATVAHWRAISARGGVKDVTERNHGSDTRTPAQKFASAYSEWMEATATVAKMDAGSGGMGDEEANPRIRWGPRLNFGNPRHSGVNAVQGCFR